MAADVQAPAAQKRQRYQPAGSVGMAKPDVAAQYVPGDAVAAEPNSLVCEDRPSDLDGLACMVRYYSPGTPSRGTVGRDSYADYVDCGSGARRRTYLLRR